MTPIFRSALLFILAGLMEIGGGYLVWQWYRHGRVALLGIAGMVLLALYGIVATYQPAHFGRVYAAYGGVFVAMSVMWGWGVDNRRPDIPDIIGALLCVAGAAVMMYWPRSA
jgi:small multidrug resistance family-3 protein